MTTHDRLTVTDEMLESYQAEYLRCFREGDRANNRKPLQAVLDLIADTAPSPDPRTDLAGYLGLTDEQASVCTRAAKAGDHTIHAKVGARLIEQDQARADEPDDGLIPVTVRLTVEEVRAAADELATWTDTPSYRAVNKLRDACADIDLWKSPLADLPDLTEDQCRDAYYATMAQPDTPYLNGVIGRALIAAGWTPEEEA